MPYFEGFDAVTRERFAQKLIAAACAEFGFQMTDAEFVAHSENVVYRVTAQREGTRYEYALRISGPTRYTTPQLEAECRWIAAISRETSVAAPEPVAHRRRQTVCPRSGRWKKGMRMDSRNVTARWDWKREFALRMWRRIVSRRGLALRLFAVLLTAAILSAIGCRPESAQEPMQETMPPAEVDVVISQAVTTAPTIDGAADEAVWASAPAMGFVTAGGANAFSATGSIKSVYTAESVYFLVEWTDPTESLERFPWTKLPDGSWAQLGNTSSHDENRYYEDKLAFIWSIDNSIALFSAAGCQAVCHAGEGKPLGVLYTGSPGERGDIWHWKSVRTNPVGYVDDQYLDDSSAVARG